MKPPSGLPGTTDDTIWVIKKTVYGLKDSNRAFYNLLKKTILSFTSTEKIKFEVGTAEQCLFIARDATGKAVTYIVGYVDDLIVADRSNKNHVSKQIMECIQKYWKVSDEGHVTLAYTSPEMLMGDGLLTIHLTSLKQKRNLINTLCRYRQPYRCRQIGM